MRTVTVRKVTIGEGIPKICVPMVGAARAEILKEAETITHMQADLVEWRVDWFEGANPQAAAEVLTELRKVLGELPLLFTFRTKQEGGQRQIGIDEYVSFYEAAVRSGNVDLIDAELFLGEETVTRLIHMAHSCGVKVIASNHDFAKTPKRQEILKRLCAMQRLGADILKIAAMPKSRADVLELLAATEQMHRSYADRPVVTMSMGSDGVISRLCGEAFGSAITFGSAGKASAPGQLPADELAQILSLIHRAM
ncbi:MAG: type I 3-dehydroquinate dehydratase [Eubacterium sp.]|nr:type I 3-dehydroquinate dehydratase [Eubacterium sp.]